MQKNRILIIPSWYPNTSNYLVGSFFREQAALLLENGYDVKILYGNIISNRAIGYFKNKFKNIISSHKSLLKTDYLIQEPNAFSFKIYQLVSSTEEEKHKLVCRSYMRAFSEILAKGWKPDIIHAQCSVDGGIIAYHLSHKFNIPFIIIEHQVFLLSQYSRFKQILIKDSFEHALKVGAVSNHQKRCILMHSIKCNPLVIWNYIDENQFQIAPIKSHSKFRIITISYPSFIKDMETFFKSIEAFSQLCTDDFEIVIIGNNSFDNLNNANTNVFENMAKKYNVFSRCNFISYLPRIEIAKILNTANVFISTSIAETFGVAVREAMYCGIPVIATRSGGVEDSINPKTGILVNLGDYDAIAHSIISIKNKDIEFDADYIRSFAISQCGKQSFLSEMKKIYS